MHNPCVHGLKYVARSDYPVAVRAVWALMFLASVAGLVVITYEKLYSAAFSSATKTSVASTRVLAERYPFPSVTVCPQASIAKTIGLALLRSHWAFTEGDAMVRENATTDAMFVRLLRLLQDFRYPLFASKWAQLDVEALRYLGTIDAWALVAQTFPPCRYVLTGCVWRGDPVDCCSVFKLQQTNAGFCYAFNSCTDIEARPGHPCTPMAGVADDNSGFFFITLVTPEYELLDPDPARRGHMVVTSNPFEVPEPANGFFLRDDEHAITRVTVSLTVQEASDDLRSMDWRRRGCKFDDEQPLAISPANYTERTCLEECRLRLLAVRCGCVPFFYRPPREGDFDVPSCDAAGLECVFRIKHALRRVNSVPLDGDREVQGLTVLDSDSGTDCQCPPECFLLKYDADLTDLGSAAGQPYFNNRSGSFVLVRQRNVGASNIRYRVSPKFTFSGFLADLGNIAALFLGVSILSMFEFIVMSVTCLHSLWKNFRKV